MASFKLCADADVTTQIPVSSRYSEVITSAVVSATQLIETYIRRKLDYAVYTEFFASRDSLTGNWQKLWVANTPIDTNEVVKVWYSPSRTFDDDTLLTVDEDYTVDAPSGKITMLGKTIYAPNAIKVQYTGGYQEGTTSDPAPDTPTGIYVAPEDLKLACIQQAAFTAERLIDREDGQENKKTGIAVLRAEAAARAQLIPEVRLLCNKYRRQLAAVVQ